MTTAIETNQTRHKLNICKDVLESQENPTPEVNPEYVNWLIDHVMALGKRQPLPIPKPLQFMPNIKGKIINSPIDHPDLDTYKFSNEVPTNKSFYDMGLCQYDNASLDQGQEGRYLREYCVQRAGANHFLHFRNLTDLRSQHEHLNPIKLLEELLCERLQYQVIPVENSQEGHRIEILLTENAEAIYPLAYRWAEANRALQIDRKRYLKMIYVDMKDMDLKDKIKYVEKLAECADDIDRPEITMKWTNYINSANVEKEYLDQYFRSMPELAEDEEVWKDWEETLTTQFADGLDRKDSSNPYSTNRLFNGNEALTPEFQTYVKNADMKTIRILQSKMFPQKRTYAEIETIKKQFQEEFGTTPQIKSSSLKTKPLLKKGKPVYDKHDELVMIPAVSTGLKFKPPEYHYFTPAMVSHFWNLIKLRKQELNKEVVDTDDLTEHATLAIDWIKKLGTGQVTCTIIQNAIIGKPVNVYGIKINFNTKLDRKEANTLWQIYKTM